MFLHENVYVGPRVGQADVGSGFMAE